MERSSDRPVQQLSSLSPQSLYMSESSDPFPTTPISIEVFEAGGSAGASGEVIGQSPDDGNGDSAADYDEQEEELAEEGATAVTSKLSMLTMDEAELEEGATREVASLSTSSVGETKERRPVMVIMRLVRQPPRTGAATEVEEEANFHPSTKFDGRGGLTVPSLPSAKNNEASASSSFLVVEVFDPSSSRTHSLTVTANQCRPWITTGVCPKSPGCSDCSRLTMGMWSSRPGWTLNARST